MKSTENDFGILLIAYGNIRYYKMAVNLVKSIQLNHGKIPVAIVTDITITKKHTKYFDVTIPVNPNWGTGFSQKMKMYEYSPFQKTLFIDADCMIIDSFQFIIDGFNGKNVSVLGVKKTSGPFIGTTIEKLRQTFTTIEFMNLFNGGVYYFEKGEQAAKIFEIGNRIFHKEYHSLGLHLFNGKPGDEPAMAIAMAISNCDPFDDMGKGMYTPVGMTGTISIDVLKHQCKFVKYEKIVTPCIMHFGGGYPEAFHYRREMAKINFHLATRLPRSICSFIINTIYNPVYAVYVFLYRTLKTLFKGAPFKFKPILPMFRFE